MSLILLREQPGVEQFEWQFAEKGEWTDYLEASAQHIAEHLFGISEYDIDDDLEDHFEPLFKMMRDESDAFWAQYGWDVTDGNGKELAIMDVLTRPMACMVKGLHPDARFTRANDAWAKSLEREAARFRGKAR